MYLENTLSIEEEVVLRQEVSAGNEIAQMIIYNDDVNTFDWVIECLMEICNHTFEQSEQLSVIIHFKGKATVKTGAFKTLKPMKDALIERGLNAVIETFVND